MNIKIIENLKLKEKIALNILGNLPEWFGIEESLLDYVDHLEDKKFYSLVKDQVHVGFFAVRKNNLHTAELYVNGILKKYHNKGYGKLIMRKITEDLKEEGYKFIMVKTIGESLVNEAYSKTRNFYKSMGFYPLGEIEEIWGKENPCLIMVKNI